MPQSEKLFGRYHDIAMLLTGFLLTTIVGGYLSHSWQTRSAEIQRVAEQKRNEIQAATAVFEDISRLMDKRLYRMRRISMGVGNDVDADIMSRRWDAYRESLFEWNENLNRYLALTQMYFGQEARNTLERDIQTRFIAFGRLLENSRAKKSSDNTYAKRLQVADDLNNYIYEFDLKLIDRIQHGDVGSFMIKE
jgi:phosphoglycerate-specific signal transduction histidine kinase